VAAAWLSLGHRVRVKALAERSMSEGIAGGKVGFHEKVRPFLVQLLDQRLFNATLPSHPPLPTRPLPPPPIILSSSTGLFDAKYQLPSLLASTPHSILLAAHLVLFSAL
jgi:hypothetical protein